MTGVADPPQSNLRGTPDLSAAGSATDPTGAVVATPSESGPAPSTFVPPRFGKPSPLGRGQAIDSMSGVAAPLLAGFGVATIGLVISAQGAFLLPGPTLVALISAVLVLVGSLQCGFHARSYLYTADELTAWWPDIAAVTGLQAALERDQRADYETWRRWANRAATLYNAGIVSLGIALCLALMPPGGTAQPGWRWIAAGIAAIGTVVELIWILRPASVRTPSRG